MGCQKCSLLIVDDEQPILTALAASLKAEFEVMTASTAEEAMSVFAQREIHIILCDQRLPGTSGIQLLEWVRKWHPSTRRMLMTGFAEFEDAVEAINRGNVYRYVFKPWRQDELLTALRDAATAYQLERSHAELLEELRRLNEELEQRVRDRTRQLEEANRELHHKNLMLERLALTDELTGIPNRRAVEQLLCSEIRRRTRYPSSLAVALVDADQFKEINTRYLFCGGDHVLISLAKTLSDSVRSVDTVGRLGGDEFMVVAPQTDLEGGTGLAERIRAAVERAAIPYQGKEIRITVSVGLVVLDADCHLEADQLIHEASATLAEAKMCGKNRCIVRTAGQLSRSPIAASAS